MNHREAFEKVKDHLLTQMEQSLGAINGTCAYRGERGLKCAIGALIPDDEYYRGMEGKGVASITLPESLRGLDLLFLRKLQSIHDCCPPRTWAGELGLFERDWKDLFDKE